VGRGNPADVDQHQLTVAPRAAPAGRSGEVVEVAESAGGKGGEEMAGDEGLAGGGVARRRSQSAGWSCFGGGFGKS
jgi:hypothetical protein